MFSYGLVLPYTKYLFLKILLAVRGSWALVLTCVSYRYTSEDFCFRMLISLGLGMVGASISRILWRSVSYLYCRTPAVSLRWQYKRRRQRKSCGCIQRLSSNVFLIDPRKRPKARLHLVGPRKSSVTHGPKVSTEM